MIGTKLRQNKKKCFLAGVLLWFLLCLVLTPVYTTVTLTFAEDPSGEVITTVYAPLRGENITPSDAKSRVVNEGVARISYLGLRYGKHAPLKRIDPIDHAYDGELAIKRLTVRQNGIPVADFAYGKLFTALTGNEQVSFANEMDFTFAVTGEDPQLLPTEYFEQVLCKFNLGVYLVGAFLFGAAILLFAALCAWFAREIKGLGAYEKTACWIFLAGLLGAVLLCWHIGLRSPFWLNPDEYDVKAAVNYYFTHFMPPDIRSDIIGDSYPVYGTSRHFEFNMFYFYTAKVGQFFADAAVRMRLFNLLLFGAMAGIAIRNIRRNYALLFVLLLTPQVWYIFSYATSDGLDFFAGFLCLYELTEENSMLNRLLRETYARRHILYYALLSILFLHLFWAKATFYPILLFVFLILLIRLFYEKKEERGVLLRKYLILAGLTLGLFALRYLITDFPRYGFDKLKVIMEVTEKQAEYGYKPSTPAMEAAYSMRFFEKGITLKELLTQFDFNKNLFRTFAGFFGSYAFGEGDWYYLSMGVLYAGLILNLLYRLIRMKDSRKWWEAAAAAFVCFLQYALIVFNSWFIDFQPQGRYLLPALFYVVYLIFRVDRVREDKVLRSILLCTCVLSLFAFWHVGVPNLVPNQVRLP